MHILPRFSCQRFLWRASAGLACAGLFLASLQAETAQSPAPTSMAAAAPAWQRELAAAHVLQTAAALTSADDSAAGRLQQERLGQLYQALAAKYPAEHDVQRAAGDYFHAVNDNARAIAYWQRAETLNPNDGASAEALGAAALNRGDVREARTQFQRAVSADPNEAAYHFDLANVLYMFRHDLADPPGSAGAEAVMVSSLEQFRLAANLAPADAALAQAYAETFYTLAKPDWEDALAAWEKVRLLDAPHTAFANGNLARISLRLDRPDAADKYLDAITDPAFADLKANLHEKAAALRRQQPPSIPR